MSLKSESMEFVVALVSVSSVSMEAFTAVVTESITAFSAAASCAFVCSEEAPPHPIVRTKAAMMASLFLVFIGWNCLGLYKKFKGKQVVSCSQTGPVDPLPITFFLQRDRTFAALE